MIVTHKNHSSLVFIHISFLQVVALFSQNSFFHSIPQQRSTPPTCVTTIPDYVMFSLIYRLAGTGGSRLFFVLFCFLSVCSMSVQHYTNNVILRDRIFPGLLCRGWKGFNLSLYSHIVTQESQSCKLPPDCCFRGHKATYFNNKK